MKASAALVLALLADHPRGLTQMEALDLGAGDSLAQRVHELRGDGHRIHSAYETTRTGKRIVRYSLLRPVATEPYRGVQEPLLGG